MTGTITVHRYSGSHPGDIASCISRLCLKDPHWSWFEPRPGYALDDQGNVDPGFSAAALHPTLRCTPLPPDIPMDEARLFWPWGALHLLDDGNGDTTRWALWRAGERDDLKHLSQHVSGTVPATEGKETIMLRNGQELKRFGLIWPEQWGPASDHETKANLISVATFTGSDGLIGWTIIGKEKRS